MAGNLIIGCASGYDWDDIKFWVNSIKKNVKDTDIAIVSNRMTKETIDKLTEEGVKLGLYGLVDRQNNVNPYISNIAPHVERFFFIWDHLNDIQEDYDNVITTDVRDVIFQDDPFVHLKEKLMSGIFVSSECMYYKDEPWGKDNMNQTFGTFFGSREMDETIYNVGVIGGDKDYVKDLLLMIFQMSRSRPIQIVDQAVFNFIIKKEPYKSSTWFGDNTDAWAVHLGTSEEAVKAGSGDLGKQLSIDEYQKLYNDEQPVIDDTGIVKNHNGEVFSIVHQWDRIPNLKTKIETLYGDSNNESNNGPGTIFHHPV